MCIDFVLDNLLIMFLFQRSKEDYQASKAPVDLPSEIIDLVNAFPFGLKESVHSKSLFCPYLPSRQRATELADIYYRNVAWMYVLHLTPVVINSQTLIGMIQFLTTIS